MYHYFGRVIFDSMIVIATERARKSQLDSFDDEDIKEARIILDRTFQLALAAPKQNPDDIKDIPQPPIFYLSMVESSSDILRRLQETTVKAIDGLQLHLHENTCSRCSLKFGVYSTETGNHALVSISENDGKHSAYDQSKCHPVITLKYSETQKFFGGIAHTLTLGIPNALLENTWPGFFNVDEECKKCKKPPGSPGCTLVDTCWNRIKVDHKSGL